MCVLFCLSICSHASVTWSHSCVAATLALLSCNFDKGLCNYTQDTNDDFDWTRQHGSTSSSNTGPRFDHTQNNLAGKCLSQQPWPCITHTHTLSLSLSLCHTHAYIITYTHTYTNSPVSWKLRMPTICWCCLVSKSAIFSLYCVNPHWIVHGFWSRHQIVSGMFILMAKRKLLEC